MAPYFQELSSKSLTFTKKYIMRLFNIIFSKDYQMEKKQPILTYINIFKKVN